MMDGPAVVVGEVMELREGPAGLDGRVSVRGALVEVAFDFLPDVRVGDTVLFQAGVALARLQEEGLEAGDNRAQEG
jgi:hydrogenase maturation factor